MVARTLLILSALVAALGGLSTAQAKVTLYNGALGTAPDAQGWTFGTLAFGFPAPTQSVSGGIGGSVFLDTRPNNPIQSGYSRVDQVFNSNAGVELSFSAQVLSESHANLNRAGFSVIMLDSAHRGIELGFWEDRVFAQNVGFTHGEEVLFNSKSMLQYRLRLTSAGYNLNVSDGGSLNTSLSGTLHDYSGAGFVYPTPNFLFMGDDTSSASAACRIASVSGSPIPEPSQALLMGAGLVLVLARRSRRRITS